LYFSSNSSYPIWASFLFSLRFLGDTSPSSKYLSAALSCFAIWSLNLFISCKNRFLLSISAFSYSSCFSSVKYQAMLQELM
jgi:hypothetical protein